MGLTIAWSGTAILGLVIVLIAAIAVRPFWHYATQADLPKSIR